MKRRSPCLGLRAYWRVVFQITSLPYPLTEWILFPPLEISSSQNLHHVMNMRHLHMPKEIENALLVTDDQDLYTPLFRNVSVFKRSYELMELILKVYPQRRKRPHFSSTLS
ncbi:hypothetical protein HAX54_036372 [Datura stramonium]|uniref:Uncharacterized protein n=1 Tax=Datura stramonium TaxID=4076 RepID=A0ABS8VKQ8_DATST|nr:hypothetical protein [Datura stramonium]